MSAKTRRPTPDQLARQAALLTARERVHFRRLLRDLGILERAPRGEYKRERNDAIRHARFVRRLTIADIAKQEGMSISAVRMVLYRTAHVSESCAWIKSHS